MMRKKNKIVNDKSKFKRLWSILPHFFDTILFFIERNEQPMKNFTRNNDCAKKLLSTDWRWKKKKIRRIQNNHIYSVLHIRPLICSPYNNGITDPSFW